MTKKDARARRLAWNTAIAEGRLVRFAGLDSARTPADRAFRMYATADQARAALAEALEAGIAANLVDPALADLPTK